jgi:hypothetical protein
VTATDLVMRQALGEGMGSESTPRSTPSSHKTPDQNLPHSALQDTPARPTRPPPPYTPVISEISRIRSLGGAPSSLAASWASGATPWASSSSGFA